MMKALETADAVFAHLPFLCDLPLADYWTVQITENAENSALLAETFSALLMGVLGIPAGLLSRDTLHTLQTAVTGHLERRPRLVDGV